MANILGRGDSKLVSILIPSRGRLELLNAAIKSVIDTAKNLKQIEIIIRLDNDDIKCLEKIRSLPFNKVDIVIVVGNRYGGYANLHFYVNEMCAISKGDFLFLFNDNCKIQTKNWDNIVSEYLDQLVILRPFDGIGRSNTFPIVSRRILDIIGYFSLSAHNDSWIQQVANEAKIEIDLEHRIEISHDRLVENNNDQTFKDRENVTVQTSKHHYSEENQKIRHDDAEKLIECIRQDGYK